ncbi:pirin family protein [Alkalibacter saccharofermentans]|uniref:Pirin n=1 Tax=Alkalibacter saccharofermentans DSM 14828 TaxID=1120975 RepID=A0A1M4XWR8_9FIRM|nr:pirin family protein [Alkalibacter saccharofermentans]SHE97682.1 hypothetical protein SAMN02746064_01604 [Alkalibacter saccharofermentans DSM 14828]
MTVERKVKEIIYGHDGRDGAGVNLKRVFSRATVEDLDPFLLLDAFDSTDPNDYIKGFPWHPHRGIETVTYLLEGKIEHGDSLGNSGTIDEGCCQWMSAGSGIIHQEMPQASERMLGVQLWVNLPAEKKMSHPAYRDIRKPDVVLARDDDVAQVRVIAGSYGGKKGPVGDIAVAPGFLDILLYPGKEFAVETEHEDTVFAFIIDGEGIFEGELHSKRTGLLYEDGDQITFSAGSQEARVLVFSGKKLKEPVAWGGPIVMNTQEELERAFKELDQGTFIKHKNF